MPPAFAAMDEVGRASPSIHRLKFFVDPELAADIGPAEAGRRLAQYVADVNTVFTRETVRSFVFDPATDLQLVAPTAAPACSYNGLVNGEVVVCVSKSTRGYSHGGLSTSWTFPQKGVTWNLNWIAIHDPLRLSRAITPAAPESTQRRTTSAASSRPCCTSWSTCSAPARASTTTASPWPTPQASHP